MQVFRWSVVCVQVFKVCWCLCEQVVHVHVLKFASVNVCRRSSVQLCGCSDVKV